jgi:hypothetical protein
LLRSFEKIASFIMGEKSLWKRMQNIGSERKEREESKGWSK